MRPRNLITASAFLRWNVSTFAGLATFTPASVDVTPGTIVTMDLTLTAEHLYGFDTADVVINSDAPFEWKYGLDLICPNCATDGWPFSPGFGIKPYDLYVGGSTPMAFGFGNSLLLGTLAFDTATLAPGTYETVVSSELDHDLSSITHFGTGEGLEGQGSFTVVPEPSCVGLFALAATALHLTR
ncbi:MAG: hypothetical protein HY287_12280 [Planctomycetes bacterium]|nr:hypothetical protein [Planctomycetota bacterium]MBI3835098.1 hypothetical protein [Planctomycetota bacterium]